MWTIILVLNLCVTERFHCITITLVFLHLPSNFYSIWFSSLPPPFFIFPLPPIFLYTHCGIFLLASYSSFSSSLPPLLPSPSSLPHPFSLSFYLILCSSLPLHSSPPIHFLPATCSHCPRLRVSSREWTGKDIV